MSRTERSIRRLFLTAALGFAASVAVAASGPRLGDEDARALFEKVLPPSHELEFKQIPWRLTVLEALVEAQLADKPILLWQKRGQPMGFV